MSELSDDSVVSTSHDISTLEDSSIPPLEPLDGLPEQQKQPQSIPSTTTVDTDFLRDIYLWKKKNLSFTILLVATISWLLLEFYKFNFVTVVSWIGMFYLTSMFLWGNMHQLLKRETPNMSAMEMSEDSAMNIASTIKHLIEAGGRWMFRVGAQGEWFEFVGAVAALYVISLVASYVDLLTFLIIGVVTGLSLPVTYMKYENKIEHFGQSLRAHCQRYYELIDDKLRKISHRLIHGQEKIKKTE